MHKKHFPSGAILALDCDGTLTQMGGTIVPDVTLQQMAKFERHGGRVVLLSGRAEPHLRATLEATGASLGLGECGYILVDRDHAGSELLVPQSFYDSYSNGVAVDPAETIAALGIPTYLDTLQRDGRSLFVSHKNSDRRVTYCTRAIRKFVDIDALRADIRGRFGNGFTVFRNGQLDTVTMSDGSVSPVDSIHVAPCVPDSPRLAGKAHGISGLLHRFGIAASRLHFGGDSLHDLESGHRTGVNLFGVANCDEPHRWHAVNAYVTSQPHSYGVAEYIRNTFHFSSAASVS